MAFALVVVSKVELFEELIENFEFFSDFFQRKITIVSKDPISETEEIFYFSKSSNNFEKIGDFGSELTKRLLDLKNVDTVSISKDGLIVKLNEATEIKVIKDIFKETIKYFLDI